MDEAKVTRRSTLQVFRLDTVRTVALYTDEMKE